jgi:hypothetical protein
MTDSRERTDPRSCIAAALGINCSVIVPLTRSDFAAGLILLSLDRREAAATGTAQKTRRIDFPIRCQAHIGVGALWLLFVDRQKQIPL